MICPSLWQILSRGLCASLCSVTLALCENLDIEASKVVADEKQGVTTATGNVKMIKGEDKLNADVVKVYVDKARKPLRFEAMGNVDFLLLTEDGRRLKGKSDTLIYTIATNEYQLIGRAQVQEIGKPNFLKGERILLNNDHGFANVESSEKAPVRVIIDLNDLQKEQSPKPSKQESQELESSPNATNSAESSSPAKIP